MIELFKDELGVDIIGNSKSYYNVRLRQYYIIKLKNKGIPNTGISERVKRDLSTIKNAIESYKKSSKDEKFIEMVKLLESKKYKELRNIIENYNALTFEEVEQPCKPKIPLFKVCDILRLDLNHKLNDKDYNKLTETDYNEIRNLNPEYFDKHLIN